MHPKIIDYNNPITATIKHKRYTCYFSFQTSDGALGAHPWKQGEFIRNVIQWSEVSKIQIYSGDFIDGFKFINKDSVVVLEVGNCDTSC